jgi:hypothetical protein
MGEITADVVKKLRDHGNRIERLEKVEYPKCAALSSNPGETASALTTDQSGHLTLDQLDATTLHTTTLLADHIGEHTAAHGVVVDNNLAIALSKAILQEVTFTNNGDEGTLVQGRSGATALTSMSSIAEDVVAGKAGLVWYTYNAGGGFAKRMTLSAAGGLAPLGGFGCNTKLAQGAYASGGAVAPGAGAYGASSAANFAALATLVANIRLALVANGIMS